MLLGTPTGAFSGQSTRDQGLHTLLETQWRLPHFAHRFRHHRGYRAAGGSGFVHALNYLGTLVTIVDPVIQREIPQYVQSLIKGVIHLYRTSKAGVLQGAWDKAANVNDDARAVTFLNEHSKRDATHRRAWAQWFRLGFYEMSDAVVVRHHGISSPHVNDARQIRFVADVPYELVLFVGYGPQSEAPAQPPDDHVIARGLVKWDGVVTTPAPISDEHYYSTENQRWFKVGYYVPDVWVLQKMAPQTRNLYLKITGRYPDPAVHDPEADVYWHMKGWDRALEVAKIPMWAVKKVAKPLAIERAVAAATGGVSLTPDVRRPDVRPWSHEMAMRDDGAGTVEAGPVTYALPAWKGKTDRFNRKSIVPPGFCFVKFNCLLYVRVVAVNPPDWGIGNPRFKEAKAFPKRRP